MRRFLDRPIAVVTTGEVRVPASFVLDGREYQVAEVLSEWPDYGYGSIPLQRRHWWQRRHRNYYLLRTGEGRVFEVYHERGTKLAQARAGQWFVTRQLR